MSSGAALARSPGSSLPSGSSVSIFTGSAEPAGDVGVERAQGLRLGAFWTARPGTGIPGHHVDMCPGDARLDEFLHIQRRGDRAGMRSFRDVVEVGRLAVEQLAIRPP